MNARRAKALRRQVDREEAQLEGRAITQMVKRPVTGQLPEEYDINAPDTKRAFYRQLKREARTS